MQVLTNREQKSNETKKEILDAVDFILNKYDVKILTVRNVCDQAGVSIGSFYNFYKSKENVLFEYSKSAFLKTLSENPIPETIDKEDFIKRTIWPFLVYSVVCSNWGKEYIKYLYQNCESDVFIECCFQDYVMPSLQSAADVGFISHDTNPKTLERVVEDLKIIIHGAVWCWSSEGMIAPKPLYIIVEQIVSRILLATASDTYLKFISKDKYHLLSDDPEWIERNIHISSL